MREYRDSSRLMPVFAAHHSALGLCGLAFVKRRLRCAGGPAATPWLRKNKA
jgi:hypothetical protein